MTARPRALAMLPINGHPAVPRQTRLMSPELFHPLNSLRHTGPHNSFLWHRLYSFLFPPMNPSDYFSISLHSGEAN